MDLTPKQQAWMLDQLSKSIFFHQKLHEWQLVEVADQINQVEGEKLAWNQPDLAISSKAWQKVIHRGIKPVIVFAHPQILQTIARSISYYRMLAMVSQKSMNQVGLSTKQYEDGFAPDEPTAQAIAKHLNKIVSNLIELDERLDRQIFDLWRGMAAGSQAQGSWQNTKGDKIELLIKEIIQKHLKERGLVAEVQSNPERMQLKDGRRVVFTDEPDIGFYHQSQIVAAIEVKGGIDTAGVLERVGAAIKSLIRAKEENPQAITILILQGVSMTPQSITDLQINQQAVNHWFTVEEIVEDGDKRQEFFKLLQIE